MAGFYFSTPLFPVPRFPKYFVTDEGIILSAARGRLKRLRANHDAYGYPSVSLCDGKNPPLKRCVHKIVAEIFLGPRPEGMEVRHKDGNKTNNRPENLVYATHAENMSDMARHEKNNQGSNHGLAKLTEEDVIWIRSQRSKMLKQAIADKFGISKNYVTAIWRRTCWKHI